MLNIVCITIVVSLYLYMFSNKIYFMTLWWCNSTIYTYFFQFKHSPLHKHEVLQYLSTQGYPATQNTYVLSTRGLYNYINMQHLPHSQASCETAFLLLPFNCYFTYQPGQPILCYIGLKLTPKIPQTSCPRQRTDSHQARIH